MITNQPKQSRKLDGLFKTTAPAEMEDEENAPVNTKSGKATKSTNAAKSKKRKAAIVESESENDEDEDTETPYAPKAKGNSKGKKATTTYIADSDVEPSPFVAKVVVEKEKSHKAKDMPKPIVKRAAPVVVVNETVPSPAPESYEAPSVEAAANGSNDLDSSNRKRKRSKAASSVPAALPLCSPFDSTKIMREVDSIVKRRKSDKSTASTAQQDSTVVSELAALKERYNMLKNLRETEPEKMLKNVQLHSEEREKTLNDLISHWKGMAESAKAPVADAASKEEVKKLTKENASLRSQLSAMEGESKRMSEEVKSLKNQLATQKNKVPTLPTHITSSDYTREELVEARQILSVYEKLTALTVMANGDLTAVDGEDWTCVGINRSTKQAIKFHLNIPSDGEIEYTPVGNASLLPDYLQQRVSFETSQAPLFFAKMTEALHGDEE